MFSAQIKGKEKKESVNKVKMTKICRAPARARVKTFSLARRAPIRAVNDSRSTATLKVSPTQNRIAGYVDSRRFKF